MKHNTRHWAGITAGILSLAGYASAASLGSEKYTYDASGNIIEKSIDGKVTKMAYDKANRLTEFQTSGQGRETTAYDNAGRPVAVRNANGQTTRNLCYGYGDKVLETRAQDLKAGFYYNAAGQLVGKKIEGNVSTYTWDGNVLAAEGSEAFANEAHISGGVPVLTYGRDVVVSDYLGNTLASGQKQYTSTAYGECLEEGRLTGKIFVNELNSFLFHHRLYSPKTASWKTMDPLGYPDGANGYAYTRKPSTQLDPLGTTITLEYLGNVETYAYQSKDGTWDIGESHTWGATTTAERLLFAWADYYYNRVEATPDRLDFRIVGEGMNTYPDIGLDSVNVNYRIDVSERPDHTLSYNPSLNRESQDGPLKAGVSISATPINEPEITFICEGGTSLQMTTISGFGINNGSLAFTGSASTSVVYGLGTFTYSAEQ